MAVAKYFLYVHFRPRWEQWTDVAVGAVAKYVLYVHFRPRALKKLFTLLDLCVAYG